MKLMSSFTQRKAIGKLIANITEVKTSAEPITLTREDHNGFYVMTAAVTVTVPSAAVLHEGFDCRILATGGTVTIDGTGATNLNLTSGKMCVLVVAGGVVYAQDLTLVNLS